MPYILVSTSETPSGIEQEAHSNSSAIRSAEGTFEREIIAFVEIHLALYVEHKGARAGCWLGDLEGDNAILVVEDEGDHLSI